MADLLAPEASWEGVRVAVLGLGRSGRAATELLLAAGAQVHAIDDRQDAALSMEALALRDRVTAWQMGASADPDDVVSRADVIVVSPGVPGDHPLVAAAERQALPVLSELELACRRISAPVVMVTGTNGKSTTTSLVHALLSSAGHPALLAGNIGRPVSDVVSASAQGGPVVIEASSFQLERVVHLHPHVATLLNIAPDHLDRYPNVEAYAAAKRNMLLNLAPDDAFVFAAGDPHGESWARGCAARVVRFGLNPGSGDGAWIEDDQIVRQWQGEKDVLLPAQDVPLLGRHNLLNALAAVATCLPLELPASAVIEGLSRFGGLPHRLEMVGEIDGVHYVNDSKATNVHAASTALAGLEGPIVVLLGGRGKGESYAPLRDVVHGVKLAICYGEEGDRLARTLEGRALVERCRTMADALEVAGARAESGDTVLLAPACASFDEFLSFEHRGEAFRNWVQVRGGLA